MYRLVHYKRSRSIQSSALMATQFAMHIISLTVLTAPGFSINTDLVGGKSGLWFKHYTE